MHQNFSWPSKVYNDQIEIICQKLKNAKRIFCIAHPDADGDALGSQLALYHYCIEANKECVCLNFDGLSEQISWLDGAERCQDYLAENDKFDLGFLMETTEARRMGDRVKYFSNAQLTIHLDHHINVKGLGNINLIDEKASSTCEILYNILLKTGTKLNKSCLTAIYVGIMTDTGNFRYSNSTPRAHEIAAEIVRNGIDIANVYSRVYENTSYKRVKLHGLVMSRTKICCNNKLAASYLLVNDFQQLEADETESDGAVRNISTIQGIEAAILFKETKDGKVKISMRSAGKLDVMTINKEFNGGGHKLAAGSIIAGDIQEVMDKVISRVSELIVQKGLCK